MVKKGWKTVLIAVVCVAAGYLLGGGGIRSRAYGQSEGVASGVICVVGQQRAGFAPIVIVDVPDQTLLVYEYSYGNDRIELTAVRSFRFDKLLRAAWRPTGGMSRWSSRHMGRWRR